MSPRSAEQFGEIREEKKHLISSVAMELFAEKGFHKTSISDISRQADISKGLMYNYFSSKEDLILYIMTIGFDKILNSFDKNHDGILEPHEMEFYLNESFDMVIQHKEFWILYFRVCFQPNVFELFKDKIQEMTRAFTEILTPYLKKMGFENPEAEMILFGSMMDGISLGYVMNPNTYPIEMVRKTLIEKYCKKIK